ncbi:MAG: LamG protein [Actinomycetia bacterium]|nr:LamG protein [Actinomycetes bacterium]
MAGKCSKALIVVIAALVIVAGAPAASPDIAAMNLQASDVPGAKVVSQRAVNEKGYLAAYVRSFMFAAPNGAARLISIQSETKLAASALTAKADVAAVDKAFRSKAGRQAFITGVAKQLNVKASAVMVGKLRKVAGYDQTVELPTSITVKGVRVYENLAFLSLDRVAALIVETGLRPIGAAVTAKYANAIAGHIATQLAPAIVTPPSVTGTAQQGQTLTATPGTWSAADATLGYQWQRCDAAGANCVDVPGATTSTYAVTTADVGATLRVVVTGKNRFGSAPATSAQTAVVT